MRWVLLIILLIAAGVMVSREVLAVGEGRRAGEDEVQLYRRFRRRLKGVLLLIVLFALAFFYEDVAAWAGFGAREVILYAGATLIFTVWALILAGRDVKETAMRALAERRQLSAETLDVIDKVILSPRSGNDPSDDESGP